MRFWRVFSKFSFIFVFRFLNKLYGREKIISVQYKLLLSRIYVLGLNICLPYWIDNGILVTNITYFCTKKTPSLFFKRRSFCFFFFWVCYHTANTQEIQLTALTIIGSEFERDRILATFVAMFSVLIRIWIKNWLFQKCII